MKSVLTMTAVIEVGAGLLLATLPSLAATLLFGLSLDTPAGSTVVRIAGAALLAIGVTCWLRRNDGQSQAARGLVGTLVLYNAAVLAILVYGGIGLGMSSNGLWPSALVHAVMTALCVMVLLRRHP
jgi:hypothetical protein